jgi:hypothetical protein
MLGTILLSFLIPELQIPSSPGLEPRTDFRRRFLCFCNLPTETNNFGLGIILLSCLVSELKKQSSPGLELENRFFWVVAFVPIISLLKQTTMALVLFFYHV